MLHVFINEPRQEHHLFSQEIRTNFTIMSTLRVRRYSVKRPFEYWTPEQYHPFLSSIQNMSQITYVHYSDHDLIRIHLNTGLVPEILIRYSLVHSDPACTTVGIWITVIQVNRSKYIFQRNTGNGTAYELFDRYSDVIWIVDQLSAIQIMVWITRHLNSGQVKVHYSDVSDIKMSGIKIPIALCDRA